MKHFLTRTVILLALCLALASGEASAAGPDLLSYQGQVLTSGGAPIANGSYPAIFTFFPVPAGGSPLWSETGSITTTSGLFNHTLGSITPIPAGLFATNSSVWLDVTVNGQIQTPRTQLTSAGNALAVSTVDGATGGAVTGDVTVTGNVGVGTTSPTSKLDIAGDLTVSGNIIGSTPWTPFPFAAGYNNYVDGHAGNAQVVQYRKIGDIVYLRGFAHKADHGTMPYGAVIGTLPVGFRPPALLDFSTGYPVAAVFEVNASGVVASYYNPGDSQSLDGIFYSTTP